MKVALVYAKSQSIRGKAANAYAEEDSTKGEYSRDEIYPPLGILTLAAICEQLGHSVRILDDCVDTIETIREGMARADVVGISSLTPNARRARELGTIARQELGRFTVLGGPHPTTNPDDFLKAGAADICVQGEGDRTLPEILEHVNDRAAWDGIQGITFLKDDGEVHQTPRRELIRDLDALPWPAWHLLDMTRYMSGMVTPGVSIMTSRGCPFSCTFCDAEMTPRQYRAMKPDRVCDLIEHLLRTYNPQQIFFFDDLFTIQRKRVIGICKEIVRRDLAFEWSCESRVDTVDFEMLRWMRRAGCVKIYFGLESGSPNVLVTMKKDVTPEKILKGAKLTREIGIFFKFFILYGFPSDTKDDHLLTEDLVVASRPDAICCSILVPIPGTEVYEQIKDKLKMDVTEQDFHFWHHSDFWDHPVFSHDELMAERERLLKRHAAAMRGLKPRLVRKWERLRITLRNPVLLLDFVEILRRRTRHRRRVQAAGWNGRHQRDRVKLQIPTVRLN